MSIVNSGFKFVLFTFFVMSSAVAHAETGKKPDPASVSLGKKLYEQNCQTCHQKEGVGETPVPIALRKPGYIPAMPLNETSHAWHHPDEQMVNTILNGTPSTKRMPAWRNKLSVKDAQDIVAYIKSLWSPNILACQGSKHMSAGCAPKGAQRVQTR
ncbi:MAG TPA: cytochrome c [Gammaproteobacteria bacterium]|nr:cytochrome c [Gammaproteobacteria bacterium]